jgi:hypothetical protein
MPEAEPGERWLKRPVLSRLEDFWVGGYPALAQCLVLEKQGPGRTT